MLLEKFKTAKQPEIQALRQLEYINMLPLPLRIERPSFLDALRAPNGNRPHVIAEFKRASPSRGDILMDFPPEEAAKQYAEAGASCLSVLTEETYFKGTLGYLKRMSAPGLPLLRKDFIFDRLQVAATAATPASALLLIVLARESGARIIQVNARDLDTLQVDRSACLRLAERFHQAGDNEAWIAASGISASDHLRQAAGAGYQAVLVGTSLMDGGAPGAALKGLLER